MDANLKKLLFPAFADAGANGTFATQQQQKEQNRHDHHQVVAETEEETPPAILKRAISPSDDSQSEATTTLHDNLSPTSAFSDRPSRKAKAAAAVSSATENSEPTRSSATAAASSRPTFFPSTAPKVATSAEATEVILPTTAVEDESRLDYSSMTASTSSVLEGQHFFPYDEEGKEVGECDDMEEGEDVDPTPIKDNLSSTAPLTEDNLMANYAPSGPRKGDVDDEDETVSSTASEMGTVINMSSKVADVNSMISTPPSTDTDGESLDMQHLPSFPQGEPRLGRVPGLTLPCLGEEVESNVGDPIGPEPTFLPGREGRDDSVRSSPDSHHSQGTAPSASALVSAAFRRASKTFRNSYSAPSTPLGGGSSHHHEHLEVRTRIARSNSYLLRSPGSSAQFSTSRPSLSPRFSSWKGGSSSSRSRRFMVEPRMSSSGGGGLAPPLKFARGCLSFDSTMDSVGRYPIPESTSHSPGSSGPPPLMASRSWDVGVYSHYHSPTFSRSTTTSSVENAATTTTPRAAPSQKRQLALRMPQRIEIEREDALDILSCLVERSAAFEKEASPGRRPPTDQDNNDRGMDSSGRSHSFSSMEDDKASTFAEVGGLGDTLPQTPLVLPTTVQEEMSSPPKTLRQHGRELEDVLHVETELQEQQLNQKNHQQFDDDDGSLSEEFKGAISQLRNLSRHDCDEVEHERRMRVIDELLLAHNYAGEMKRATKSASVWLKSISRNDAEDAEDRNDDNAEIESHYLNKMDIMGLKAVTESSEAKLREKDEELRLMKKELAKHKAEIGRLSNQSSRSEAPFKSPDRSILDSIEDDSASETELSKTPGVAGFSMSPIQRTRTRESDGEYGYNVSFIKSLKGDPKHEEWKAALEEANATIRKLHSASGNEGEPPVVQLENGNLPLAEIERNQDEANESFESDWMTLMAQLPPPPDHGLRSPIVEALLEQWTTETCMHESLLQWMERVMNGADPANVPPLMISSLDQEVREGLAMHVLPLLQKRPDIQIDAKTRTRRKTVHDLSVTILSNSEPGSLFTAQEEPICDAASQSGQHSEMASVAHSAATAQISNASKFRAIDSVMASASLNPKMAAVSDEASVGSSATGESQRSSSQQGGLMSSITSFGGLLTRRSNKQQAPPRSSQDDAVPSFLSRPPQSPQRPPSDGDEQPYHRVVSAPPGRIGVTFVQYRGHAMVSDVAPESPLSGWVFPSDILIAIDEVPVSGMRVRDIVKLLTTRKERQRALRVISSHAMNEFTLNSSAVSDVVS